MAITASHLKVQLRGLFLGQVWQVIQWFEPEGAVFLTADVIQVAEAWWNHFKTPWRNFQPNSSQLTTESILISEPGSGGAYAEYAIPVGEKQGLRSVGTSAWFPPFVAAGFRQTVATRTTRPGQKRFPGLLESDADNGILVGGTVTLINAMASNLCSLAILGAPVATGVLHPRVVRLSGSPETIVTSQRVTGYVTNPNVTTQNSRKYGRGI